MALPDGALTILDAISLDIDAGERVAIVGESGSGKTMTANSIMRLLPPGGRIAGGQITFDGEQVLDLREDDMRRLRGKRMAMIFQNPMTSLNPAYTVGGRAPTPCPGARRLTINGRLQARARAAPARANARGSGF